MTKLYDSLIGIPWYHPRLYAAARLRMADAFVLPKQYAIWREGAEAREEKTGRSGAVTMRVYVDGDEFVRFCAKKGFVLDSKARSNYATSFCANIIKSSMTRDIAPWLRLDANRG